MHQCNWLITLQIATEIKQQNDVTLHVINLANTSDLTFFRHMYKTEKVLKKKKTTIYNSYKAENHYDN